MYEDLAILAATSRADTCGELLCSCAMARGGTWLASIIFAVIVFDHHLPGGSTITRTVVCTMLLSIILHGLSANPLVKTLAARIIPLPQESGTAQ